MAGVFLCFDANATLVPKNNELNAFTTDGCSTIPNGSILNCCKVHDLAYWQGGTAEQKEQADQGLRLCVTETTHMPNWAATVYAGVHMFGGPLTHRTYRWGYGWKYMRPYAPLTDEEMAAVQSLMPEDVLAVPVTVPHSAPLPLPAMHGDHCTDKVFACLEKIGQSTGQLSAFGWRKEKDYGNGHYTLISPNQKLAFKIDFLGKSIENCSKPAYKSDDLDRIRVSCTAYEN